jgi:uncharacterized protein (UPF0335 family)
MQSNTQSALRHICERLVALENDKAEIAEEIKTTKAAAKADGFDAALISKTVRIMRMEKAKQEKALEQHDLFDSYLHATGLIAE